jgi:DNA-binding protein HU-beta
MNTTELVERVATEHGVAKEHTKRILDTVFTAITAAASAGDDVVLAGFGRFKVSDRAARQGRNPATGETIAIAASKKLTFSPAKNIRDALNVAAATDREAAD